MSKKPETNKDLKAENATENGISSSRRQFTKTGLLASPVLMSVVSRPVFGVGCLSNMLSGNLSEPDRGECNLGLSPGYWKEHPEAWPMAAGFKPDGTVPTSCNDCLAGNGHSTNWICNGGALFNSYFTTGPQDSLNRSMLEILCTEEGSDEFHIIAALLNAMTVPNYVMTVEQVKVLWADPTLGGQIGNFKAFLNSTWT
ncbi:hypothetical protein [Sedimenticola sp.]|uniref:hypothetical protein n=1 Tax=Sedimenticola sp. TaxID=1940285 RepID=UPI003D145CE3